MGNVANIELDDVVNGNTLFIREYKDNHGSKTIYEMLGRKNEAKYFQSKGCVDRFHSKTSDPFNFVYANLLKYILEKISSQLVR
ncbi:MAG: hypothetical protein HQK51_17650 [Oligoflexia bacterium]|nr:hypothetical protein [Oligoflexia bacterium]